MLETHSAELLKVSEDFRPLATKYALVSFYEENVERAIGTLVGFLISSIDRHGGNEGENEAD